MLEYENCAVLWGLLYHAADAYSVILGGSMLHSQVSCVRFITPCRVCGGGIKQSVLSVCPSVCPKKISNYISPLDDFVHLAPSKHSVNNE